MSKVVPVQFTFNGRVVRHYVEPRLSLVDLIRHELQFTGTHVGCEMGMCGACLVRLNGRVVNACLSFAVQADGATVETIEGLSDSGEIADLQSAFLEHNALQCGFCTPGILMTANELLGKNPTPTRDQVRDALSGNYCRCTGYEAIVDAISAVAKARAKSAARGKVPV